jgi:hypothetical protein
MKQYLHSVAHIEIHWKLEPMQPEYLALDLGTDVRPSIHSGVNGIEAKKVFIRQAT